MNCCYMYQPESANQMMELLEHIYTLTKNHKSCWKDVCCQVHLEQLRIRGEDTSINGNISSTSERETLLLKLTIIQKLFSRARDFSCSKLFELCNDVVNGLNLLNDLLLCLHSEDQLIAFSASKALSNILVVLPLTTRNKMWFYTFLDFQILKAKTCPWVFLYSFAVLSHLFHCYHSNISSPKDKIACVCHSSSDRLDDGNIRSMTVFMISCVLNKLESLSFAFVPFWKEFRNMAEILGDSVKENKAVENGSQLFGDLCIHIHKEKIDCCPLRPMDEDNFFALLLLLVEVLTCVATSAQERSLTKGNSTDKLCFTSNKFREDHAKHQTVVIYHSASPNKAVSNSKMQPENSDSSGDNMSNIADLSSMCKIFPLLVHYLHIKQLSHITFKKILDVIDQVLVAGRNLATDVERSNKALENIVMVTARSFISIFSCCIWENLPKCEGFLGFGGRNVQRPFGLMESTRDNKCVDRVALRKVSIVLLRTLELLSNCKMSEAGSVQVMREITGTLSAWAKNLQEAVSKITWGFSKNSEMVLRKRESYGQNLQLALFELFSDQDDELVEMLQLLLTLYQRLQDGKRTGNVTTEPHTEDSSIRAICHQIDPHTFFVNFLKNVCFDHSVILDFLVSTETVFLSYLVAYLHCILNNWSAFVCSHESSSGNGRCEADNVQHTSEEEDEEEEEEDIFDDGDIQKYEDDLKSPASFGTSFSSVKNVMLPFGRSEKDGEHNCEIPDFLSPNSVMLLEREDTGFKPKEDSEIALSNTKPEFTCSTAEADHLRMRKGKRHDTCCLEAGEDSSKTTTSSGALQLLSLAYDDDDDDDEDKDDGSYSNTSDGDHKNECDFNDKDGDGLHSFDGKDDDGRVIAGIDDDYVDTSKDGVDVNDGRVGGVTDDDAGCDDDDDDNDNGGDSDDNDDNDGGDGDYIKGGDVEVDRNGKDECVCGDLDNKVDHIDKDYGGHSYGDVDSKNEGEDEQMQFAECRQAKFNCFVEGVIATGNWAKTSFPTDPDKANACIRLPQPIDAIDTVPKSLEKTMSVLIRLRLSIERLATVGLFPYSPGPLLRLMERVEQFYDDC